MRAGYEDAFLSPQGFEPLPTQSVPLCTILRYHFLATDPKNSLNAASAPIYSKLEDGARAKKRNFLVNIFRKVPKNVVFWPVF